MQSLSIQDFSKRIKDIYKEVAYDMYQSYTTRSPTPQPAEDLMSLPEIEGEKKKMLPVVLNIKVNLMR